MILAPLVYTIPRKRHELRPSPDREYTTYFKLYSLFSVESRSYKTCARTEALKLLSTGKWFDKTVYTPFEIENNEVLNYGNEQTDGKQECIAIQLQVGQESQHQLDNSYESNLTRTELDDKTVRSGSSENQVRGRGRPKRSQ